MKLLYKDNIIKESNSLEEIEQYRKEFISSELKKKNDFQKRWLELEEAKKYVITRNCEDSEEAYIEKVKIVNNDFITKFENLLSDMGFEAQWIKYKNISKGCIDFKVEKDTNLIRIVDDGETLSFMLLGGMIICMTPLSKDIKIVE